MAARFTIDDDVRDVLARSTITDCALTLPAQLSRELYQRVDKVLRGAGGRWNRAKRVHVFDSDPRALLGLAVETGEAINRQQLLGAFYTPAPLAKRMAHLAGIAPGSRVLEPSAGRGALALACRAAGAEVLCVEIDDVSRAALVKLGFDVLAGDFLHDVAPIRHPPFDAVVMNPPFADGQDVEHVTHALWFLRPGGRLVAIMPPGWQTKQTRACAAFRGLIQRRAVDGPTVEPLPPGTFKASGTDCNTVLLSLTVE